MSSCRIRESGALREDVRPHFFEVREQERLDVEMP